MIEVTPLDDLGRMETDWLSARFHFSFADYMDPARVHFGPLRVWNDDLFRPGGGFPMHPHRDMEIITYIRGGAISHEDSLGNGGRTAVGDVQVMSAGTGIVHSEFNSEDENLELFQIWIFPDRKGLTPRWEPRRFTGAARAGALLALVSGNWEDPDVLHIHQDATLLAADLDAGQAVTHILEAERRAYMVPPRGAVEVNGVAAPPRAGIAITGETEVHIRATEAAEVVLLDLP